MLTDTSFTLSTNLDHDPSAFTILIVDNDVETTKCLVQTILRPRGYETSIARTGREALSRIRRIDVDLILLSWQLPDMNGEQLLQTLVEASRHLPSIVMATRDLEHVAARAFRLGARGYLNKPLEVDETIQAIRQVLTAGWGRRQQARQIEYLRQQLQRFVVLGQVAHSVMTARQPDALLTQIVDAAILVTGAEEGFVLLTHPDTSALELRAMRGLDEETTQLVRLPVGDTSARQVVQTGMPLRLEAEDPSGHKVRTGYLVKGLIHVPIKTPRRVMGVLSVDRKVSSEPFTAENEEMLAQLAGCAAVALENARQFHEIERARQLLTGKLEFIQESLDSLTNCIPEPDETQRGLLDQLGQAVEQANLLIGSGLEKHR